MEKDPYKILGVSRDASQKEISQAYKKLAKLHHPDLNPGKKEAEAKFKNISEAYEKIETPEARKKYQEEEELGRFEEAQRKSSHSHSRPFYRDTQNRGGRYSFSSSDEVEDLFKNFFGGGGRDTENPYSTGSTGDRHYTMDIDFKDAALGGEKEIILDNNKRLKVNIPAGIQSGTQLRFQGQGDPGPGGVLGSAFVKMNVLPSPYFKRVGNDVELEVPISFSEAIIGSEIKVPTIDGSILLKIPKGATTGMRLRAKGKGIKIGQGMARGDQINILRVEIPSQIDPALEEFMMKWSAQHPFQSRPPEWGSK